jgi:GST-like protein
MDRRLAAAPYLAGDTYTIADIAAFPWVALHRWFGLEMDEYPDLARWYGEIKSRPAVQRGMDVPPRTS